jgi:valyl-tRNA synthetase
MDKRYQPQVWENKIYHSWEKAKAFTPKRNHQKQPFTIVMPPPNANGALHIGHAMFITLEDIWAR